MDRLREEDAAPLEEHLPAGGRGLALENRMW